MRHLALVALLAAACSTVGGLSDTAMPDRFGIGTSTGSGVFGGSIDTFAPGAGQTEAGRLDGTIDDMVMANLWLEWDIPSAHENGRTSFEGMRNRFVEDYRGKPEPGLLSVTKKVDEYTGEETYDFNVGTAAGGSLATLLTFLGYRQVQKRRNGNGHAS